MQTKTSAGGPAAGVHWDLSDLYTGPDDPALEADLERSLAAARTFAARHRGRLASLGAAELAGAVDAFEALQEPLARVSAYAQLLFAADTSAPRHGALLQHVQERGTEIRNELLFFELEWVALAVERADVLLADPALARRRHFLASLRRYRPHLLSEPEERILSEMGNTGRHAFARLFDELMADTKFRVERDGESGELGEEEVLALLYHPGREQRRAGARSLTAGLRANARPLAFIFNTLVRDKAVEDRLRSYPAPMAARNLANEIDGASVDSLLSACVARYPLVARYYRLKARMLGLERLEDYDRYAPLTNKLGARSFDEARRVVLDAYADFSPRMAEIARRFFDERWIDAELREGKRGGAFCASTAARQGLFEQETPLTTAETASVFGEMLVFRRLMREESEASVRLALLCGKLEDAFATVFRQVAMTRFEALLHAARRAEGELPIERVNALWMDANRGGGCTSPTSCTRPSTATPTPSASCSCWPCCGATTRRGRPSCRATWRCWRRGARTPPRRCWRAWISTSATPPSGTGAWWCSKTWWPRRRRWRAERPVRASLTGGEKNTKIRAWRPPDRTTTSSYAAAAPSRSSKPPPTPKTWWRAPPSSTTRPWPWPTAVASTGRRASTGPPPPRGCAPSWARRSASPSPPPIPRIPGPAAPCCCWPRRRAATATSRAC
jgi:oligoendopeptidase F